jgi:cytoskeletal protein RodZ
MLLNELVELLATHFNILNDDITNVLKAHNIRIGQRLLLEKKDNNIIVTDQPNLKPINKPTSQKDEKQVIANNDEANNEEKVEVKIKSKKKEEKVETNVEPKVETNVEPKVETKIETKAEEKIENKESKPARGRGRPKKNMVMKEEEDEEMCVEVEEVDVCGVKYYKTSENVILSKALEIEGIMRDGKLVRSKK